MTINTAERQDNRMETDRTELARLIARALPHEGTADRQPGANIARFARRVAWP